MLHLIVALLLCCASSSLAAINAPVLKWQHGGCYSSWCETGWYSSPAVADLDNDGNQEVIAASYSIFVLNGTDGENKFANIDPPGSRVWPGVVVADLDDDDDLEFVTAHGDGYVHVFNHLGATVWSRKPAERELRGLAAADLDADGDLEIVVTGAVLSKTNTWVYNHQGTLLAGWPQLSSDQAYAYGVFNDNAAIGDIDGDGRAEIVVPSDVHYICAYNDNGSHLIANAMYGSKTWGAVGIWESLATELRGWGYCSGSRAERYRTNFAHGAAALADVDGDCRMEIAAVGNVYDCQFGHPPGKYNGVYLFNADRSRYNRLGFDWRQAPVDTGAPLSESYSVIESNQPNPVIADIDGDGLKEMLFSSYDGRVHCYWLDKNERHFWPYRVNNPAEGFFRFASEPVVADLDNNGMSEVLFTSWVQKGSNRSGHLFILNYRGQLLHKVALPNAFGSPDWNGGLPAPTLADIDSDDDLEVVINTAHAGVVAYDLPGTANARLLWATGRGNYRRDGRSAFAGSIVGADFSASATSGQEPFSITFNDLSTGCINTHLYDFGDGEQSSRANPLHTFEAANGQPSTYTVSLTIGNPFDSDTRTRNDYITVAPCPHDPVLVSVGSSDTFAAQDVQSAYDAYAQTGSRIDIQARRYNGPLTLDRDIGVSLYGGRGCANQKTAGVSRILGKMTISRGYAQVEKVSLEADP